MTAAPPTITPSSRIIVKNLPKWSNEERIRKHFASRGQITDVKLMHTRSGVFRRFAYIGFASVDEAASAVNHFDKTFIDTSRIQVEFAQKAGSAILDRPWSKYSTGSSAHQRYLEGKGHQHGLASAKETPQERPVDALREQVERRRRILESIYGEGAQDEVSGQLKEFLAVSQPTTKGKMWENDPAISSTKSKASLDVPSTRNKARERDSTAATKVETAVEVVPSRKPGGQGQLVARSRVKHVDSGKEEERGGKEKDAKGGSDSDDLYEDFALPPSRAEIKNSPQQQSSWSSSEDELETVKGQGESAETPTTTTAIPTLEDGAVLEDPPQPAPAQPELSPELIAETGRLFVRNLSYCCTEAELRHLFEPFGPLSEVHLSISRESKKPKGFAYILFMFPEHALRAYSELDGTIFLGRILHILPAYEAPERRRSGEESLSGSQSSSFQKKKQEELKGNAQKDYNWNSLFMRSDTVLEAVAAKLGVGKATIMNVHDSDNLATRMAIAETNLIHETKAYLEAEGVVLDAFSAAQGPVKRSDTVILVKNLSFETESAEIRRMFAKFGTVGRVVLPPTKAIALVEFFHANEARSAFRALAYSRFKNAPLFLEWAPMQALKAASPPPAATELRPEGENKCAMEQGTETAVVRIKDAEAEGDVPEAEGGEGTPTLYVKNLNFETASETLRQVFSAVGAVRSARVATKKAPDGTILSLGFGFVEFEQREALNRALDELQGHIVDGHALVLKRSVHGKTNDQTPAAGKKKSQATDLDDSMNEHSTKLLVRNIPFEASEKEVRELFKTFAQLKRLRLPRKFDGNHRGFGFVDFLTHQEAANAKKALAHTHLYGRHLVLEWARTEGVDATTGVDSLELLRAKASRSIAATGSDQAVEQGHSLRKRLRFGDRGEGDAFGGSGGE